MRISDWSSDVCSSDLVSTTTSTNPVPRLKTRYDDEIRAALKETLGLGNIMEVPRLEKIVVNMGVGAALAQPSLLEGALKDLGVITGQKPVVTKAKKSIANFKRSEEHTSKLQSLMRISYAVFCLKTKKHKQ